MINKSCVFICDDHYEQALFLRALSDVSPETLCFAVNDAHDALFILSEEKVMPNYIFVELNMPRMNGLEFLKIIKKVDRFKDIPVIVHSTSPQPNKIIELKEFGASAIYLKPYEYYGICNMLNLCFNDDLSLVNQN
jgi:PleD family two-component response regulator